MSGITIRDDLTERKYQQNGFDPSKEDTRFSYTSARVGKPIYNSYQSNDFKVFGYFTDWCQYDARLDGEMEDLDCGRGRDLMNLNPQAFDKIVLGFCGIKGDNGEKKATIDISALDFTRSDWQPTFTDSWGDVLSYRNVGFRGWVSNDVMEFFNQNICQGILGGLRILKQQNPNLGISISIGGWTMSEAFHGMVKESSKRSSFCSGVMDILSRFPMINELDIDWEYPNYPGHEANQYGPEDVENFALLIKELKAALSNAGRNDVKLSIACSAAPEGIKAANIPLLVSSGITNINLMTYDFFGTPWASSLSHHTNLNTYPSDKNWSVDSAVNLLISSGIPAKNIFIGYAAYSRNGKGASIQSVSPLKGSYTPGSNTTSGTFESGSTEYYDIIYNYLDVDAKGGKNGFQLYTDTVANADFLYNPTSKVFMSIDTPRSVKAKGEYVRNKGLGGLFTWTIDMDHGLLCNAAREGLGNTCTNKVVDMSGYYFSGKTSL